MAVQTSWNAFSAFQVFGDHVPVEGFSLVIRIEAKHEALERLIEGRAESQDALDPELAKMVLRAGLGMILSPAVSFVYSNVEETVVLLRSEAVAEVGQSLEVHDHLLSRFVARLTLISGAVVPVCGRVYEFPDLGVVRKAVRSAIDLHEDGTPLRSARRLGAQLRGRGQPFHLSMVDTIEEQTHLLEQHGVDMNALPSWWWRGVAVRTAPNDRTRVELWSELPATDDLVEKIG